MVFWISTQRIVIILGICIIVALTYVCHHQQLLRRRWLFILDMYFFIFLLLFQILHKDALTQEVENRWRIHWGGPQQRQRKRPHIWNHSQAAASERAAWRACLRKSCRSMMRNVGRVALAHRFECRHIWQSKPSRAQTAHSSSGEETEFGFPPWLPLLQNFSLLLVDSERLFNTASNIVDARRNRLERERERERERAEPAVVSNTTLPLQSVAYSFELIYCVAAALLFYTVIVILVYFECFVFKLIVAWQFYIVTVPFQCLIWLNCGCISTVF